MDSQNWSSQNWSNQNWSNQNGSNQNVSTAKQVGKLLWDSLKLVGLISVIADSARELKRVYGNGGTNR